MELHYLHFLSNFSLQIARSLRNMKVSGTSNIICQQYVTVNNAQREQASQGCQGSVVFPRGGNKPHKYLAFAMRSECRDPLI